MQVHRNKRTTRALAIIAAGVLSHCALGSQPITAQPSFEVATVKPATPGQPIGLFTWPGGRITATNYKLRQLIQDAYSVDRYQVLGGPAWIDTERYSVEAKPPDTPEWRKVVPPSSKTPPTAEMRRMLQRLLAERFQLQLHRETRQDSVYVLVATKSGPKLKPPTVTAQPFVSSGRTGDITRDALSQYIAGQNATMAMFAIRLAQHLSRPVLDESGIAGSFDFRVEYAADETQSDAAASLFRAIQDQLSLKLEARKGPVEVLVIDHAEKPSEN